MDTSKLILQHLQRFNDTFLEQFVTVDETWLLHYDSEKKHQSFAVAALSYSTDKEIQETKVSRKGHGHSF